MRFAVILGLLALILVLACSGVAGMAHAASGTATVKYPDSAYVNIKGGAFTPDTVTIAEGGYVIWTNTDSHPNSVKFDSYEKTLGNGSALTRTYGKAGTYTYANGLAPKHTGTVIVK